jgi:hypothetical protein
MDESAARTTRRRPAPGRQVGGTRLAVALTALLATALGSALGTALSGRGIAAESSAASPPAASRPAAAPPAAAACPMTSFATGRVQAVIDGRTFILDDRREVRLAGIEIPADGDATGAGATAEDAARAALAQEAGENEIVLKHLETTATPPTATAG